MAEALPGDATAEITAVLLPPLTALTASDDGTAKLWDVESVSCVGSFEGHAGCGKFTTWPSNGFEPGACVEMYRGDLQSMLKQRGCDTFRSY